MNRLIRISISTAVTVMLTAGLVTLDLGAQNDCSARQLHRELKRNTDMWGMTVPGFVLRMGSWFVDDAETRDLLRRVGRARILTREAASTRSIEQFIERTANRLDERYEPLMTVRDGSDRFNLFVRDDGETVRELVLIGHSDTDLVFISLDGKMQLDQLAKLAQQIN